MLTELSQPSGNRAINPPLVFARLAFKSPGKNHDKQMKYTVLLGLVFYFTV